MFIIIALIIALVFVSVLVAWGIKRYQSDVADSPISCIYCLMVTGKDDQRICFARKSIDNFIEQDYNNKKLIIINHNVAKVMPNRIHQNVFEFQVPRDTLLGDMRNIALEMVPIDAMWTTWDDDDYRTHDYLSILKKEMDKANADVVTFTARTECNYNTGFVWEMKLMTGFVTLLAKQDKRIKYKSANTMEDTSLIADFQKLGKKFHVFNNDPLMYIRLVHGNNTSLYVNQSKQSVLESISSANYQESNVDKETQYNIMEFISRYFKGCLQR